MFTMVNGVKSDIQIENPLKNSFLVYSRLRYTQPDLVRPIRVNLVWPILYLIATAFVVIVPMIADPVTTGVGCLMILSCIPVYYVLIAWRNKPKAFQRGMGEYQTSTLCNILANCLHILFETPPKKLVNLMQAL